MKTEKSSSSVPALCCTNKTYLLYCKLLHIRSLAKMGRSVLRPYKLMLFTSLGGSKTRYNKGRPRGRGKPAPTYVRSSAQPAGLKTATTKALAGGDGRFGLGGAGFVDDGGADEVAPFRP